MRVTVTGGFVRGSVKDDDMALSLGRLLGVSGRKKGTAIEPSLDRIDNILYPRSYDARSDALFPL